MIHRLTARIFALVSLTLMVFVISCGSDTNKIVFVSEVDGDAEIYVIDPKTGIADSLTDNRSQDTDPVWSPDGSQILYVSDGSGDLEITMVDGKGDQISRLTNIPGDDKSPRWSPNGEDLAFISNQDGNAEVYLISANGGRPIRITDKTPDDSMGDWSPDGQWLAFSRRGSGDEMGLWLRNPDGVNLVHLTQEQDSDPHWSPNGKHVVFVRETEGNQDLYLVSRLKDGTWQDNVELTRLTQHEDADHSPDWSPDGDTIAVPERNEGNSVTIW